MKKMTMKDIQRGEIRIRPEGWVNDLVFSEGRFGCGITDHGMGIRINEEAGGVMTVDDLLILRDALNRHLDRITKDKLEGL